MTALAKQDSTGAEGFTGGAYLSRFAAARATLPGAGLPWLASLREEAIERFAEHGFPTRRVEEWKFTNLSKLTKSVFAEARPAANGITQEALAPLGLEGAPTHLMVFVNGRFRGDLSDIGSLPDGVTITSLAQTLESDPDLIEKHLVGAARSFDAGRAQALASLNAAFMTDGAVIRLDEGTAPERPVHLLFLALPEENPTLVHPRNLFLAEAGACATVIETYAGLSERPYWTNAVTQVVAAEDAGINHFKLQAESLSAFHIASTEVVLDRNAYYASFVMSVGGELSRHEIRVRFAGEGVHCALKGASLARGRQHMDNLTRIDHLKPNGVTNEVYKSVVDDRAHAVFQGKLRVAPGAQKTNAYQLNQNLLLSEKAQADSKPELEILADDVKCSHGATVGELDKEALFYLRSRGLDESAARGLLIEAFVGELIDGIGMSPVRAHFRKAFARWLAGQHG